MTQLCANHSTRGGNDEIRDFGRVQHPRRWSVLLHNLVRKSVLNCKSNFTRSPAARRVEAGDAVAVYRQHGRNFHVDRGMSLDAVRNKVASFTSPGSAANPTRIDSLAGSGNRLHPSLLSRTLGVKLQSSLENARVIEQ